MSQELMISHDELNDFCEKYMREFKKCENKMIAKMTKYIKEGYERNEIVEKIKQDTEEIYEPCIAMNIELHTEITTRFVKSLPKSIQEEVKHYLIIQ